MTTMTFDDAGTPDVAAMMARLKLTGELSGLKKQIDALGTAAADMLARLKLAARSNEIRKQLGGGVPVVPPAPAPSEVKPQSVDVIAATADIEGRIVPEPVMDVPESWVVMNAPRPLTGTKVLEGGAFLAGRFYAAIDPQDAMAGRHIEENRKLAAVVVITASNALQVEMALIGNEYAAQYREQFVGQALYEALNPLNILKNKTAGELRALKAQALAAPAPVAGASEAELEKFKTLREVIAGAHDAKGLAELFGLIQEAVNGLDEAGMLSGDAEAVANDAITHWAELEERLSANV